MTANDSTPSEGQSGDGIEKSSDATTIEHLILENVDEARRREVPEETVAHILRSHAETLESEGYGAYTDPSAL